MPEASTDRDALVDRQLEEMTLSDNSSSSLTNPLPPMTENTSAQDQAFKRFAVEGNAIITGGGGTLALEAARALLQHGLSGLALFDIRMPQDSNTIDALHQSFPHANIRFYSVNVTDPEAIAKAVDKVREDLGPISILSCFAGVVSCVHALDLSPTEWQRTLDINTSGSFYCAQAVARHMVADGIGGAIVFIASISGHIVNFPQPQVGYNVSKTALLHMARSLAAEWARYGIRVNTLSPGYMDTILNEGAGLENARRKWNERCPMGRMGQPQELTGPLILLCSRFGGAYITGTDLKVDGGITVF